jgi:hypothetical protein
VSATPREQRTCRGCGYKFVPAEPGQEFCSGICAGRVSMAWVIAGLQRFAQQQR